MTDGPASDARVAKMDQKCAAYLAAEPARERMRDLFEGSSERMRAKRDVYLPMEASEREPGKEWKYEARLARSFLYPMVRRAILNLAGRVFSERVGFEEGTPAPMIDVDAGWGANIDLAGRTLERFLYDTLVDALVDGHSLVLVDYPPVVTIHGLDGSERVPSPVEEALMGRRPFWTLYTAEQLIWWRTAVQGGRLRLLEARFKLCETVSDGEFGERERHTVRRYVAGVPGAAGEERWSRWELWERIESGQNAGLYRDTGVGGSLEPHEEIPLVTVYTERTGFLESRPPLLELGDKNIEHYQKTSNLNNGLNASAFPMWHRSGVSTTPADDEVDVGWGKLFESSDPAGSMTVVESSGAIYGVLEKNIDRDEERGRLLAHEPMRPVEGITATSDLIRSDEALSRLEAWALQLGQSANDAARLSYLWASVEPAGAIVVPHNFRPEELSAGDLALLTKLREGTPDGGPDLSRARLLQRLADVGPLGPDFDFAANERELALEASERADREIEKAKRSAAEFGLPSLQPPGQPGGSLGGGEEPPVADGDVSA